MFILNIFSFNSNLRSPTISMRKIIFNMITTQLFCSGFGSSKFGQLAQPSKQKVLIPAHIPTTEPVFLISAGEDHVALLTEDSKVFTLGRNTFGQLGLGDTSDRSVPSLVQSLSSQRIEGVFCGYEHSFAISNNGHLFSWGLNLKGQLGLGDRESRASPTLANTFLDAGERVILAACGGLHSLLLTNTNKVLASGHGENGALGQGSTEDSLTFKRVKLLERLGKVDKVVAGLSSSGALVQGNVYMWGETGSIAYNRPTQIPVGSKLKSKSNSPRSGSVEELSCGASFTACISRGKLFVWGEFKGTKPEPTEIPTPTEVRYIGCGVQHLACITHDYQVLAWDESGSELPIVMAEYTAQSPTRLACGAHFTVVLSQALPTPLFEPYETSVLLAENKSLKQEIQQLKRKAPSHRGYIEADISKLSKSHKQLVPDFEILYQELEIDPDPIGRGGYGTVYRARWRGSPVAVKKMKIDPNQDSYKEFMRECQTMVSIRHPNITLFLGACTKKPDLCLVLEYCSHGSLWDALRDQRQELSWHLRCKIALDTARGVNYLHKFTTPVLHRDLKSLNILLDSAMTAKIADFGWTRFKADAMTNKIGTYQWMAPEVILSREYSEKADVYSFGIILWELATRKPPFRELNGVQVSQEVVRNDLRPPLPKRCPEQFLSLMQRCWSKVPEERPAFEQIIGELEAFLKFLERV